VPSIRPVRNQRGMESPRGKFAVKSTEIENSVHRVELDEGKGGRLSCVLTITLEEGNPWVSKTAEYSFEVAGDGRQHKFDFGPKIPIQSTINNTISVVLLNSGTTVSVRARFASQKPTTKDAETAWFALDVEYARILERLATFANLPAVPYRDFNQITTDVLTRSGHEQELYKYDDTVLGRKLRITFRWNTAEAPQAAERVTSSEVNTLRCMLAMSDDQRQVTQSYLLTTPSPYRQSEAGNQATIIGSFTSGVQIPVETQINNTKSIQYIGQGVGAELIVPRKAAPSSPVRFDMPIHVHYQRLRERAFVAQAEIPYTESVDFEGEPKLAEGQQGRIFESVEAIRGKTFTAKLSWHGETP
jgi:hypothetical protein